MNLSEASVSHVQHSSPLSRTSDAQWLGGADLGSSGTASAHSAHSHTALSLQSLVLSTLPFITRLTECLHLHGLVSLYE